MDLTKLDRTARVFAIVGLLAFIDTFLNWADLSVGGHTYSQYNWSGWSAGLGAWFPMLLLLALGVIAALPAFGQPALRVPGGLALAGTAAAVLSLVIVLLRWLTLPSESDLFGSASMSATYGLYIALVLSIVAAVFGWMGYTAEGGSFATVSQAFKPKQGEQPPTPPQA